MTTPRIYWAQAQQDPAPAQPRIYWAQAQQDQLGGAQPRVYWAQINESPPLLEPAAPTDVAGEATGATTAALSLVVGDASASHRWQLNQVGGPSGWVDAPGDNPTPPGVATLLVAGLPVSGEFLVRARAEVFGGLAFSSWVQAPTSFWTDNAGEGSSEIPIVSSSLAIAATMESFTAAVAFDGPLGYRGDSLNTTGATGNCLLPLVTLPADNAALFRVELISSSLPGGTFILLADGRFFVDPGTPNGSYSFTFRWYRNGVAQTPLVSRPVQIGPSGALAINAAMEPFAAALALEVPVFPTLTINASMEPFISSLSFGTVPSLSITATMGDFLSIMPFVGDIAGVVPDPLSTARQYRVNPDTHLDAYSIQQGYALSWSKDPQSQLDYSVEWADWLADVPGDSLANMYVTKSDNLQVTAQAIRGTAAAVVAKGGELGAWEFITIRIVTALGRIDERTIRLLIQDR
jgi:hypothetical protein